MTLRWLSVILVFCSICSTQAQQFSVIPVHYYVANVGAERWAFITKPYGNQEIGAVRFDPITYELDYSSVRFFGLNVDQLEALDDIGNPAWLMQPSFSIASGLYRTAMPLFIGTPGEKAVVALLSQLLKLLYIFNHGYQLITGTEVWTTNGCTGVPDFDFKDCCDQHDICYCIGGNADDRRLCDLALKECIRARGHPFLARLYYAGVRAFGSAFFNYH